MDSLQGGSRGPGGLKRPQIWPETIGTSLVQPGLSRDGSAEGWGLPGGQRQDYLAKPPRTPPRTSPRRGWLQKGHANAPARYPIYAAACLSFPHVPVGALPCRGHRPDMRVSMRRPTRRHALSAPYPVLMCAV